MNLEKNEGDENLKATITHTVCPLIDVKQPQSVEYLYYLGSMITNRARFAQKLNPGLTR
jgi:hypothetical protein